MALMPYPPRALLGNAAQAQTPLPSWGLPAADWRDGLPPLGDGMLTLRELEREDAPTLFAHLTTEEVSQFISPPPATVTGFEDFIRWTHRRRALGRYTCYGIVPAGNTQAVGLIQIHVDDTDPEAAEWGFVLGAPYWGTGLFGAAARRVVNFAFAHMGLTRLVAHAAVPNGRGGGALRKLGARPAGVRRQSFERHGTRLDQTIWTIARDDWWAAAATAHAEGTETPRTAPTG